MDDFIADINQAFKELEMRRHSQTYQSDIPVSAEGFSFNISSEIADVLRQRDEEDERMRYVSQGVYG
jgi:hypothetical protein